MPVLENGYGIYVFPFPCKNKRNSPTRYAQTYLTCFYLYAGIHSCNKTVHLCNMKKSATLCSGKVVTDFEL